MRETSDLIAAEYGIWSVVDAHQDVLAGASAHGYVVTCCAVCRVSRVRLRNGRGVLRRGGARVGRVDRRGSGGVCVPVAAVRTVPCRPAAVALGLRAAAVGCVLLHVGVGECARRPGMLVAACVGTVTFLRCARAAAWVPRRRQCTTTPPASGTPSRSAVASAFANAPGLVGYELLNEVSAVRRATPAVWHACNQLHACSRGPATSCPTSRCSSPESRTARICRCHARDRCERAAARAALRDLLAVCALRSRSMMCCTTPCPRRTRTTTSCCSRRSRGMM